MDYPEAKHPEAVRKRNAPSVMSKFSVDLAVEACGATGQLQLKAESLRRQEVLSKTLYLPFALIGTNENADLCLADAEISPVHAYWQVIGGRLFCLDLQSKTGTHWDGVPKSWGWLAHDQIVRLGGYYIWFTGGWQAEGKTAVGDANPLSAPSLGPFGQAEMVLETFGGTTPAMTWPVDRVLTLVGRADDCRVMLKDPSVSPFHCSLLRTALGTWVVDLLGKGGININGRRVRWARLDEGDRLQVGRFLLRARAAQTTTPVTRFRGPGDRLGVVETTVREVIPVGESPLPGPPKEAVITPEPVPAVRPASVPAVTQPNLPAVAPPPPGLPAANGTSEATILTIVNQFTLVQQQMAEQYHQSLLAMVQMFAAMRREQMDLVREEMDRINQLTDELRTLQAEVAKRPAEAPAPAPTPEAAVQRPTQPQEPSPAEAPAPFDPWKTMGAAPTTGDPQPANGSSLAELEAFEKAASRRAPAFTPGVDPARENVHAMLFQRMAEIQREREGRLKSLLSTLMGKS